MKLTDSEYLAVAYKFARENSHDPRTQAGAILVDDDGNILVRAANQFVSGAELTGERLYSDEKYSFMVHAEEGGLLEIARLNISSVGLTMYAPWAACDRCGRMIAKAGIKRLVVHEQIMKQTPEKWQASIATAMEILAKRKPEPVEVVYHNDPNLVMGILFQGVRI